MSFTTFSNNTSVAPATSSTRLVDAAMDVSSLIANVAKDVGDAAGCAPASVAASIIIRILASLKVCSVGRPTSQDHQPLFPAFTVLPSNVLPPCSPETGYR
ncbi:hypothetical protein EW146_g8734 [Bondarzewia mesenterica]|uniref:Uncharacterized protein n=1 Tax=Bondarzewia mesenterica TaxID=1095465 RepID=A0A4S4LHE6_9AGAM|nr:hypothetical protein EW146_g8734 [Bondarzewia mesenterica]